MWGKILKVSWTEGTSNKESEIKHFITSPDKDTYYLVFWKRDEDPSVLGERFNAGNHYRSKEIKEAPYAVDERHQKCKQTHNLRFGKFTL